MTEAYLGLSVDLEDALAVPDYKSYKSGDYDQRLYPHLQEFITSSPEVVLADNCIDYITCVLWRDNLYNTDEPEIVEVTLPCGYLIFAVCYGYHACQCSNGFFMKTAGWIEGEEYL